MRRIGITLPWMGLGGIEVSLMSLIAAMSQTGRYSFKLVVTKPITSKRCLAFVTRHNIDVALVRQVPDVKPNGGIRVHWWRLQRKLARCAQRRELRAALADCEVLFDYSGDEFRRVIDFFPGPKYFWWHFSFRRFMVHAQKRGVMDCDAKAYSGMVMISRSFESQFQRHCAGIKMRTVQIYNLFDAANVRELAERGLIYASDKPYFVVPSRLGCDKDNESVVKAFALFNQRHPNAASLVFIGTGTEEQKLNTLVSHMKLDRIVVFKGGMDNPYAVVKGALASILSSPEEGLPNVLLEAMALGTLPISSDVPDGPREALLNGAAGMLYPYRDVAELSKALEAAYIGGEEVDRMKANAEIALRRFSREEIIPKVESLIP